MPGDPNKHTEDIGGDFPVADFDQSRKHYLDLRPKKHLSGPMVGFWCGLIPVADGRQVKSPFEQHEFFQRNDTVPGKFTGGQEMSLQLETIDWPLQGVPLQPNLTPNAGETVRHKWTQADEVIPRQDDVVMVRVEKAGAVTLAAKSYVDFGEAWFSVRWIIADVSNALRTLQAIRKEMNQPDLRYRMLVELRFDDHYKEVTPAGSREWRLGLLEHEMPFRAPKLPPGPIEFGPYEIADGGRFHLILDELLGELYELVGVKPVDFAIDSHPS